MAGYIPRRRIGRAAEAMPPLPDYFKTVFWKDMVEKLSKANHVIFMIFKNGSVQNVYVKEIVRKPGEIEPAIDKGNEETTSDAEPIQAQQQIQNSNPVEPETAIPDPDLPTLDEIPEEGAAKLPPEIPEEPTFSPPPPSKAPPIQAPPVQVPPKKEPGKMTVEVGSRVLANYQGAEVKGDVLHIVEDGKSGKYILRLENGQEVMIPGLPIKEGGDGLRKLIISRASVSK